MIVVGLKESEASVELEYDAPDGPDVAGVRPAELKDDFGGAVVARRHDRRVVLVVEGRRAKIDQTCVGAANHTLVSVRLLWIRNELEIGICKENILWLQVGVCHMVSMHK